MGDIPSLERFQALPGPRFLANLIQSGWLIHVKSTQTIPYNSVLPGALLLLCDRASLRSLHDHSRHPERHYI